ncbi:stage II sporulation protein P [Halothermothrix orenii]|nr:stage II sporulation protein P [Halothermothrix orenii]
MMRSNRGLYSILFIFIIILSLSGFVSAEFVGHIEENCVKVYDNDGNYIFSTAMKVSKGDRYINQDNMEYIVESINGNRAIARKVGEVDLLEGIKTKAGELLPLAAGGKKLIAVYHTHNGESYLPGPENIPDRGEIHEIGRAFKEALEKKGIRAIQSDNLHLPHDGAAYERSRATAVNLLKKRPDAIFDLHRDAVPSRKEYLTRVNGKVVSQVRLVVGRQNPNREVNEKFAKQLKAVADKQYPGLIRGIFFGRGSYNQHLSPHALLLEFGTHVISEGQARTSAIMLADTINTLLYGAGARPGQAQQSEENKSAFTNLILVGAVVIIGLVIYLYLNEGSFEGVIRRLKRFLGREVLDKGDNK